MELQSGHPVWLFGSIFCQSQFSLMNTYDVPVEEFTKL